MRRTSLWVGLMVLGHLLAHCGAAGALRRDAAGVNARGIALLASGELEAAEASFHVALEYDERFAEPHNNLGLVALQRGDVREARRHFRRAIGLNSDFVEAWTNLGVALSRRADEVDREHSAEGAIAAFREALAIDPGRTEARVDLVRVLLETGRGSEALDQARRLVALVPAGLDAALYHAESALAAGALDEAARAVARARTMAPDDVDVRMVTARVDLVRGAIGVARDELLALVTVPRVRAQAYALLAVLARAQGDARGGERYDSLAGGAEARSQ